MNFKEDLYYIERTRKGDLQAFGKLVEKHEKFAYTLAMRMLRNQEEAEEATQDSFVKVFHKLAMFEGKSKFTTWLYKIVFNESLTRLRKSKNNILNFDEIAEIGSMDLKDGLSILQSSQRKELLRKGLDSIKPTESAILTLFYLEEQSINEIEDITGLAESHIKVLLHRGRKSLLNAMQKITKEELTTLL